VRADDGGERAGGARRRAVVGTVDVEVVAAARVARHAGNGDAPAGRLGVRDPRRRRGVVRARLGVDGGRERRPRRARAEAAQHGAPVLAEPEEGAVRQVPRRELDLQRVVQQV